MNLSKKFKKAKNHSTMIMLSVTGIIVVGMIRGLERIENYLESRATKLESDID